jgi:hypothetical protein
VGAYTCDIFLVFHTRRAEVGVCEGWGVRCFVGWDVEEAVVES